jgi:hypothetical protein
MKGGAAELKYARGGALRVEYDYDDAHVLIGCDVYLILSRCLHVIDRCSECAELTVTDSALRFKPPTTAVVLSRTRWGDQ